MKYLIVGLGNPGKEYEMTRHNAGFMVVDEVAAILKATYRIDRHAVVAEAKYKGRTLVLVKPITFMNLSGKAVAYWLKQNNILLENLLVVTDDIALPFGKIRMRQGGSDGGHNGLKDINAQLNTNAYPRLRIGVGSDFPKGRQADYVLSPFNVSEMQHLPEVIEKSAQACLSFTAIGISQTMTQFNN
jgi:PTH1 family peptidyl-tRNA hydrolase